jgi:hypothetical protein
MTSVKVRMPCGSVCHTAVRAHLCALHKPVQSLTGFGHFALAVPDVYKAVDDIKAAGEGCRMCLRSYAHGYSSRSDYKQSTYVVHVYKQC